MCFFKGEDIAVDFLNENKEWLKRGYAVINTPVL